MIDLQVVTPQEAVDLTKVRLLTGPVRAIEVTGSDFRSVDEVRINDVPSPDVVVLNRSTLVAQVPDVLSVERILSVLVLSKRLTITPRSILRFRLSRVAGKTSGIQRLVQLFLRILFTTPGRDIFNKRLGGGGLAKLGATYGLDDGGDILNDFIISVDQTARQIVAIQSRKASIPPDERLLKAQVTSSGFNSEAGGLDVTVEITSQAGASAITNLGI